MAKHVDNPSYSACVVYTKYLYLPSTVSRDYSASASGTEQTTETNNSI